jgi:uncharacterized protein HemX
MLSGLLLSLVKPLLALLAVAGAALGLYFKGKGDAKRQSELEQAKQDANEKVAAAQKEVEVLKELKNAQTNINNMPANSAADELRNKWARD